MEKLRCVKCAWASPAECVDLPGDSTGVINSQNMVISYQ